MIDEASLSIVRERIENALQYRKNNTTPSIEIVAITKGFPPPFIVDAAKLGLNSIGENRVQEAEEKFPNLPKLHIQFYVDPLPSNQSLLLEHPSTHASNPVGHQIKQSGLTRYSTNYFPVQYFSNLLNTP